MSSYLILLVIWSTTFYLVQYPVFAQDPCSSYSILSDESRSILKETPLLFTDQGINGWHRFMGKAGENMLDYMPTNFIGINGTYRCGTTMPGYLTSHHPNVSEDIVSRTACFVYNGSSCWLSTNIKVKNCGNYFVYKLNTLPNGTYMRYCGSGEANGVGNFSIHFNVYKTDSFANAIQSFPITMKLSDWLYFEVNASTQDDTLGLLIEKCFSTSTRNINGPGKYHIIRDRCPADATTNFIPATRLKRRFSTKMFRYEGSVGFYLHCIVFLCRKNVHSSKCRHGCPGNRIVSTSRSDVFETNARNVDSTELFALSTGLIRTGENKHCGQDSGSPVNFSLHFNTYKTDQFQDQIQNFPTTLKLGDWLYFEVNATVQDSSLALIIERCYSTPTMNPEEPGQYNLIRDRCAVDKGTGFLPGTNLNRRFSFQLFRIHDTTAFYINCMVFFCHKNSGRGRCFNGCSNNNMYTTKQSECLAITDDQGSVSHPFFTLSAGKFVVETKISPSKHIRARFFFSKVTLVFGGIAAVALIAVVTVVALLVLKKLPFCASKNKQSKEVGLNNAGVEISNQDKFIWGNVSLNAYNF